MTELAQLNSDLPFEASVSEMAQHSPASNKAISRAGEILVSDSASAEDKANAQALVNLWRASFNLPLRAVFIGLMSSVRNLDEYAIGARRLKRMESIVSKLRNPSMSTIQLSSMQDIGGCRAILSNFEALIDLLASYARPMKMSDSYVRHDDYLENPKPDGYRGFHVIVRPTFTNPKYEHWNSHKIEIQLRSKLQHAWATALETVDLFTGQKLKSGSGDAEWLRFFALASALFAGKEGAASVPGTPSSYKQLRSELNELWFHLDVMRKMRYWSFAINRALDEDLLKESNLILVTVHINERTVSTMPFRAAEEDLATANYAKIEQKIREGANLQTVLLAVDRWQNIRAAYPNLYADTGNFLEAIGRFIDAPVVPIGQEPRYD